MGFERPQVPAFLLTTLACTVAGLMIPSRIYDVILCSHMHGDHVGTPYARDERG